MGSFKNLESGDAIMFKNQLLKLYAYHAQQKIKNKHLNKREDKTHLPGDYFCLFIGLVTLTSQELEETKKGLGR